MEHEQGLFPRPVRRMRRDARQGQNTIPVLGNGDIRAPGDARRMLDETGCDAVAIGQGALGNPWIFAQALRALAGMPWEPPAVKERFAILRRHLHAEVEFSGEERGVKEMRKHLAWYLRGLPGAAHLRAELTSPGDLRTVLNLLASYEDYLIS